MEDSSDETERRSSRTKVGLLSLPPIKSRLAEQFGVMGLVTPPHHSASVPFRWEEEPGKPRSSSSLSSSSITTPFQFQELDLPPRLRLLSKFTKTPSPTSVLDAGGRSIFHSFRLSGNRHVSFDGDGGTPSLGLSRRWFVLLHKNSKEEEVDDEGSFVFSGHVKRTNEITTKKRTTTLFKLGSKSNFWATIYGAVKQVIPAQRRGKNK